MRCSDKYTWRLSVGQEEQKDWPWRQHLNSARDESSKYATSEPPEPRTYQTQQHCKNGKAMQWMATLQGSRRSEAVAWDPHHQRRGDEQWHRGPSHSRQLCCRKVAGCHHETIRVRPPNLCKGRALDKEVINYLNGSAAQMTTEGGVPKPPMTYICCVQLHRS